MKAQRHPVARAPQSQWRELVLKMEHLLQVPKCRQPPFSDKDGEDEGTAFLLPKAQVPIGGDWPVTWAGLQL